MHIFAFVDRKVNDRSIFGILYFFYHLLITVWILVGLILAYIWSNEAYEDNWSSFHYHHTFTNIWTLTNSFSHLPNEQQCCRMNGHILEKKINIIWLKKPLKQRIRGSFDCNRQKDPHLGTQMLDNMHVPSWHSNSDPAISFRFPFVGCSSISKSPIYDPINVCIHLIFIFFPFPYRPSSSVCWP